MNRLKWYSSEIWNRKKFEKFKSEQDPPYGWYNSFIGNKKNEFGEYEDVLRKVIAKNSEVKNNAVNKIKNYAVNIEFLKIKNNSYVVPADVLLTNTRDKVFKIIGIPTYMAICRLLRILNKKREGARKELKPDTVVNKIHDIFPDTFGKTKISDLIYTVLNQTISSYPSEQQLWNNIIKDYFTNVIGMLNSSTDDAVVKEFEKTLKRLIGEEGSDPCIIDVSEIINYQSKLGSSSQRIKELRHKILSDIGIKVCPYCNRNYVTWYKSGDETIVTADLDHYYQKDYYPLFALSLFNFIPSCQVCNSRLKGTNPMEETLYPFEEGFDDDASFKFRLQDCDHDDPKYAESLLNSWLGMKDVKEQKYKITVETKEGISPEKEKRIKGSKKLFRLEEIYSTHIDKALDISLIARIYDNPDYKKFCDNALKKISGRQKANTLSIFDAYFDRDWMSFGYHWHIEKDKLNFDAPLSRMTWDIFQQCQDEQFPLTEEKDSD